MRIAISYQLSAIGFQLSAVSSEHSAFVETLIADS